MTKKVFLFLFSLLTAAMVLTLPRTTAAQAQEEQDPPTRVARLNYIQGAVSYQVAGDKDWVAADVNRPLTTGDNLWADKDSRGEVHIGSTAIRLASETGISILNLDDRTAQIQLAQGTIEVHLRHLNAGDAWEFDTPNIALTLTQKGEYRIETDPNGSSTVIIVREGEGQVTGGGETYDLQAGQSYTFTGTDQLTYDAQTASGFDDFEDWCQSRDQRENNSPSAKYVSRDIDGYSDLDDYGEWQADSTYGEIWVPNGVALGWAPYHFGHWVWVGPWGWTWVEDEPWGFAPFHWGRWAFVGGFWGWVPGPRVVRPVYAPALVGFVGGGFGASIAFGGFAGVAWFPLGPRDVFIPGYRASARYVETVNVTNTRVIDRAYVTNTYNNYTVNHATNLMYMHENVPGAVTAVSRETFVNARPVGREAVTVNAEQLQSARVVESAPLRPTRASYVASTARTVSARPPVAFSQRPVVARLNPAVPVSRRTPEFTNDSRQFNRPAARPSEQPRPEERVQPRENAQPSARSEAAGAAQTNQRPAFAPPNRGAEQPQQRPAVHMAPPARAREENYDVHPPLNSRPAEAQAPREQHSSPPSPPPPSGSHKPPK